MALPEIGSVPPAFTLPNQDGQNVSLSDHAGKHVGTQEQSEWMLVGWEKLHERWEQPGLVRLGAKDRRRELVVRGGLEAW